MSLSSAQRVIYAIDHYAPLPLTHIRPHELLNYFLLRLPRGGPKTDFSVLADIAPKSGQEGIYTLALSVKGRPGHARGAAQRLHHLGHRSVGFHGGRGQA